MIVNVHNKVEIYCCGRKSLSYICISHTTHTPSMKLWGEPTNLETSQIKWEPNMDIINNTSSKFQVRGPEIESIFLDAHFGSWVVAAGIMQ